MAPEGTQEAMKVQLSGIRAVVFDLDDTLYAERDFAWSGFEAVAEWLKARLDCPIDPAVRMKDLFEIGDRRHVFDQLLEEMGVASAGLITDMVDVYRNHPPRIQLLPDAQRALDRWSGQFFLGLVSDGPWQMQQHKIDALGLDTRLDLTVLTDRWGRDFWKPHPRAFEHIQTHTGHRGRACVYIADNPAKDFVAPNLLDWRSVRISRADSIYGEIPPAAGGCSEFQVLSLDEVDIGS